MLTRLALATVTLLGLLVGAFCAWQWRALTQLAAVLDYNGNNVLEIEEVGPALKARFGEFDRDRSGGLDRRELLPYFFDGIRRKVRIRMRARGLPAGSVPVVVTTADIDRALAQMVQVLELPGAALIVGTTGHEVYRTRAGTIDFDTRLPMASASKWVSAVAFMKLVEDGRLALDRPLSSHFPDLPSHWGPVTLRQLLSFTAGVGEGHAFERSPATPYADVYADLIGKPPHAAPGVEFTYGGITMQIAGYLAEQVSGHSWSELFAAYVARPAGLRSSVYGHPIWSGAGVNLRSPNIAAGLHSSADDYFRFLSGLSEGAQPALLSASSLAEMEADHTSGLPQNYRPPAVRDEWSYGLGLWCERRSGRSCESVSSAGSYGTYPWIDRATGRFGVLVTLGEAQTVMPFALHLRALAERLPAEPAAAR